MTPSMNTYWGILWKMVDMADVVVQVVDARFPSICRSNRLEDKVREMENKNLLVVLNKTDLISREKLNQWIKWFAESEGLKAVGVSAKERLGTSRIRQEILKLTNKDEATVAIVGFPNTGKSSLINVLKGRKSAPTAPVAGHTKTYQKVKVSRRLMMYDTPGVIPIQLPKKHQYLLGIMSLTKIKDPMGVAYDLYEQYEDLAPGKIREFYNIDTVIYDFLDDLAIAKNRLQKGGKPDKRTSALLFLNDHLKNAIPIFENVNSPLRYKDKL